MTILYKIVGKLVLFGHMLTTYLRLTQVSTYLPID